MALDNIVMSPKRSLASFLSPITAIRASNFVGEYSLGWTSVGVNPEHNDKWVNNQQLFAFAQLYSYCQVIA